VIISGSTFKLAAVILNCQQYFFNLWQQMENAGSIYKLLTEMREFRQQMENVSSNFKTSAVNGDCRQ
jgi:hypothetical protein